MRSGIAGGMLLLAACSRPEASPADVEAGRKVWTENCRACHFVPDSGLAFDRIWFAMIETTS